MWRDLMNLAYEKGDEPTTWLEVYKLMEKMEFVEKAYEATSFSLNSYTEKEKELIVRLVEIGETIGNNCLNYIEYISYKEESDTLEVGLFIEPVGIVSFSGKGKEETLRYVVEVFENQPKDMDYIKAGYIVYNKRDSQRISISDFPNPKIFWEEN